MIYGHYQDFVDAYVGPFDTIEQCEAHAEFCKQRGDGARYFGAFSEKALPADAFRITPEHDRAGI